MQGWRHPFPLAVKRHLDLGRPPAGGCHGQLGTSHADHRVVFVELAGRRIPHRAGDGPAPLRLEHDHGQVSTIGHLLRLRQAHAVQLQGVVAHKQGGDQVLFLLRLGALVRLHHHAPAAARRGAEQAPHRRCHGHPALAAKAARCHLAVGQHLGVQAHAGVDHKHAAVHKPHLHRPQVARMQGLQQVLHGGFGVQRQTVLAAEIVEGAHGHHPQRYPGAQRGRRHGVDGAVAPGGHQQPAVILRGLGSTLGQLHDVGTAVGHMPDHIVRLQGGHALQLGAQQVQVGTGPPRHHQMDGATGLGGKGVFRRCHAKTLQQTRATPQRAKQIAAAGQAHRPAPPLASPYGLQGTPW